MTRDTVEGDLIDFVDIWQKYPARARSDDGDVLWTSIDYGESMIAEALTRLSKCDAIRLIGVVPDDDRQVISFPMVKLDV